MIKLKFTLNNILLYTYIIIFIINILVIFFLYSFINKNIVNTIYITEDTLLNQTNLIPENINSNKFENIINSLEKKSNYEKLELDNFFF